MSSAVRNVSGLAPKRFGGTSLACAGWLGMTRDEIEFCERWIELRRQDLQGAVPWDTSRPHAIADNHARGRYWDRALGSLSAGLSDLLELTPRGQDLVASYEAAKASGLEIRPDPGPGESRPWLARDPKPMTVVCDCDDGFIGIPVAYAPNGGILRVWPARCPKCDVERGSDVVWEKSPKIHVVMRATIASEGFGRLAAAVRNLSLAPKHRGTATIPDDYERAFHPSDLYDERMAILRSAAIMGFRVRVQVARGRWIEGVVRDLGDGLLDLETDGGGLWRVGSPTSVLRCVAVRGTPVAAAPTDGRLDDPALALDDAIARGWASDPAEIVNLATVAKEHGRRLQVRIRSSADPIGRQRLGYVTDLDLGEEMPIYFDGSWRFVGGVRPRETTITAARVAP